MKQTRESGERNQQCRCGSLLAQDICCDAVMVPISADLIPIFEREIAAARLAFARTELMRAEALCIGILTRAPFHVAALTMLFDIRSSTNRGDGLLQMLERIAKAEPANLYAMLQRGILAIQRADVGSALHFARDAIRREPSDHRSQTLMALALSKANNPVAAARHYQNALQFAPREDPSLLADAALNLKYMGKFEESRAFFERAAILAPTRVDILANWSSMEIHARHPQAAEALLPRIVEIGGVSMHAQELQAQIAETRGDHRQALAIVIRIASQNDKAAIATAAWRGALHDRVGEYEEAWKCFELSNANALTQPLPHYDTAKRRQKAESLRRFFTRRQMLALPCAGRREGTRQPIFILGFPRSGTTLLEQSLSMQDNIVAGDELMLIEAVVDRMPYLMESRFHYPEALAELWMADREDEIAGLRDFYLRKAAARLPQKSSATRFTDKTPLNEIHMGLIHLMFPDAPLLHLKRHPLDIVVSVFSNQMRHGHYCSLKLGTIAHEFKLVDDLVQHYRTELQLKYHEIRYEDLVQNQENTLRGVFNFIGEKFEARSLDFHDNARIARTASIRQVREKLYSRSLYRYRNYLRQLEPVIPLLMPIIERQGYSL